MANRARLGSALAAVIAAIAPAITGAGPVIAEPTLEPISQVSFEDGSHQEFARIGGRDYAFVATGTTQGTADLRVIDVTTPERPRVVAKIPCGTYQGHIQLSHDKKTLILGLDTPSLGACMPAGMMGFATVDISDPTHPRPVGYASIPRGSHSTAAHPTKPIVYNGDGFPEAPGEMQIWLIKDPSRPKLVSTLATGEHSPHDLSFSHDGRMAALASVTSLKLLDTSDPLNPKIEFVTQCPGCVHTHEARFTPDGTGLVVNDEFLTGPNPCPGGALYFYEIVETPAGRSLELTGEYVPNQIVLDPRSQVAFCTPHVFDISDDGTKIAASWHRGGVHYLDISETNGAAFGTMAPAGGVKEIASYFPDGDSFSAKFHRGPYIYLVDSRRGFEILRVNGPAQP
ncbi:MAG TPA: hypothetical protein VNP73_11135 [Actinomycetota bacterium]|nr:hypothetical protein [Actinomycetota bacterium]